MSDVTFEEVVELVDQLSPEDRDALTEHLLTDKKQRKQRPSDPLHIFHVDSFPEGMTLRREDEYGDDGRWR